MQISAIATYVEGLAERFDKSWVLRRRKTRMFLGELLATNLKSDYTCPLYRDEYTLPANATFPFLDKNDYVIALEDNARAYFGERRVKVLTRHGVGWIPALFLKCT